MKCNYGFVSFRIVFIYFNWFSPTFYLMVTDYLKLVAMKSALVANSGSCSLCLRWGWGRVSYSISINGCAESNQQQLLIVGMY